MKTRENAIYVYLGCLSNTGIVAGLGSLKPVKELGFKEYSFEVEI